MTSETLENSFQIGANVPRRGNAFTRGLARFILWCCRWKAVGIPPDTNKFLITAAPHTSNFDGLWFLIAAFAMGVDVRFIGKHTLFKGIWGPILRTMGGVSVVRHKAQDVVEQIATEFRDRDSLILVLAPEGTRRRVEKWKSGWHRIAKTAGVPISMGFVDYTRRRVGFGPWFDPDNLAEDMQTMQAFYSQITPKYPENFVLPE